MRSFPERVILPALVLTWALSHAVLLGGDAKDGKGAKAGKGIKGATEVTELLSVDRIRKALDQPITLDFSGQSVMEALQHLREKTGLEFNLDQVALGGMGININDNGDQPVVMKSSGGKVRAALRKVLNSQQLAYVIFED